MSKRSGSRIVNAVPLTWKLMVPFGAMILVVGSFGGFLIVRDLSARVQRSVEQELSARSLDARSYLRDRELYLLESSTLAANISGVTRAIRERDRAELSRVLASVLAVKTELNVLAVVDTTGEQIIGSRRHGDVRSLDRAPWGRAPWVRRALSGRAGHKHAGIGEAEGRTIMGIAAPVCGERDPCAPVGAVVVGLDLQTVAEGAIHALAADGPADDRGLAVYATDGTPIQSAGLDGLRPSASEAASARLIRRSGRVGSVEVASLFSPLELQGRRIGTLVVTQPTTPAFASVRGAGLRLALVLLAAIAGVVGVGLLIARYILRQLRALVETNRAIGAGDLTVRVPVLSNDELGEVAHGLNQMAEQLEVSMLTLEQRVAERTEEVQRLLRQRTEFFASISHEFRTPLAVILRHADMLGNPGYRKTARWNAESSATLRGSATQLLSLINDILELAKAEGGKIDVHLEPTAVQDVIADLKPTMKGLAAGASLQVGITIPKNLPRVNADPIRLRQVLLNLVDNAAKYTPPGGRIAVDAGAANGHVWIAVADTGVGIPAHATMRVFEPFYRVNGTTPQRGQASSGLGLALVKRFVEAQGGEIGVESAEGHGTTFRVKLPRFEPAPQEKY